MKDWMRSKISKPWVRAKPVKPLSANFKVKAKKRRSRRAKLDWHADPELIDRQRNTRRFLELFWLDFHAARSNEAKMKLLKSAAKPPWPRVSERIRLLLRKEFGKKWCSLLDIPMEGCATCEGAAKEKHHIIPLAYGGLNENINLLLICLDCHNAIHPWLK